MLKCWAALRQWQQLPWGNQRAFKSTWVNFWAWPATLQGGQNAIQGLGREQSGLGSKLFPVWAETLHIATEFKQGSSQHFPCKENLLDYGIFIG